MYRIKQRLLFLVLTSSAAVHAFLRFPCSQLVTERFDPLVTPGKVSPHLHQIVGGNAFNLTMHPDNDLPRLSSCTTCRFVEDKSNYWTAVLYFKHRNGSFIRVPQMANHNTGPGLQDGGMTVYYFQSQDMVVFRKGFRMRVGNPTIRREIDPSLTAAKATTFRCFNGTSLGEEGHDKAEFPTTPCSGGIRSNIYFPQCWDGENLDSPDHESHVAHPEGGSFFGTECPSSHPVRIPLLFMEIVWDTRPFNDPALWPEDGSQPFVFSMGDPTGFGQHADYVFGWEGDSLQRAMDTCNGVDGMVTDCTALTVQDTDSMNGCKQGAKVPEITEGQYIEKLPGCNSIQGGPEPATPVVDCDAPATTTDAPVPTGAPNPVTPPWTVCNTASTTKYGVPYCNSIPKTTGAPGPQVTPLPPAVITAA